MVIKISGSEFWMTSWDKKMVDFLRPLVEEDPFPILDLVFFANTFPLAYHYALALKLKGMPTEEINKHVPLRSWKEDQESRNETEMSIYYTNEEISSGPNQAVPVTIFRPKWVFCHLTLGTSLLWRSLRPKKTKRTNSHGYPKLMDFLDAAESAEFDRIWIYAELPELGALIKRLLPAYWSPRSRVFSGQSFSSGPSSDRGFGVPFFEPFDVHHSILRLFVYGGSLSSYFRRKRNRYLPLELPVEAPELSSKMRTYISCPSKYASCLRNYHQALYGDSGFCGQKEQGDAPQSGVESSDRSKPSPCEPFFTVYRSYNEMAWLLQHRSHFEDGKEIAQCLFEHHQSV